MTSIQYYGQAHAQAILSLLKDMEQSPDKYLSQGVHLPRGILLLGAPGMGKTLFAHKVAEVLHKELLMIKPSSDRMSSDIEEIFNLAREKKHCIVLLDEVFNMIYKDEKTEGQLLSELDSSDDFLVIATTSAQEYEIENHEALIRPGRFDIKISLSWPTYNDRLVFFKDQLTAMNLEYDPEVLAEITSSQSYAFLTTLMNHLKMFSLYQQVPLTHEFVYSTKERLEGYEQAIEAPSNESLQEVAIHELGHAVYGLLVGRQLDLVELSKRGHQASTTFDLGDENDMKEHLKTFAITLAGYASGVINLHKHFTGAARDFEETRNLFALLYRSSFLMGNRTAVTKTSNSQNEQLDPQYQRRYHRLMKKTFRHVKRVLKMFQPQIIEYSSLLVQKSILTKVEIKLLQDSLKKSKHFEEAKRLINHYLA